MSEKFKSRRWTDIPIPEIVGEGRKLSNQEREEIKKLAFEEFRKKGLDPYDELNDSPKM